MHHSSSLLLASLALATAQLRGVYQDEQHPKLQWTKCTASDCQTVNAEVTVDEAWRWLHGTDNFMNCFDGGAWDKRLCPSNSPCTDACAVDGADYPSLGVSTANSSVTQKLVTKMNFATSLASRLYLLESKDRYQTFVLLDNEFAFDVNLNKTGCGINSALHFIEMDADGGMAKFPDNRVGAEYGTGYCNSMCAQDSRYVGGKPNNVAWMPAENSWDSNSKGKGIMGACCGEVAFWDSNAHSYQMSTQTCDRDGYQVCEGTQCTGFVDKSSSLMDGRGRCDSIGCGFNPYRMGVKDFYGRGKTVDTSRVFTVVTRFTASNITQFFVQDGRKIETPVPTLAGIPAHNGLTPEMCSVARGVFNERNKHLENGGWDTTVKLLTKPLVLSMEINTSNFDYNLWLDGQFPVDDESANEPGVFRGDCQPYQDSEPWVIQNEKMPDAKVVWSNFRFGPIGSTVKA